MNNLEARLRRELPELADALVTSHPPTIARDWAPAEPASSSEPTALNAAVESRPTRNRGRTRLIAMAAVITLAVFGVAVARSGTSADDDRLEVATASFGFGAWAPISDGPLATRPYAVSAWTGAEVIFWAGTNLARNFAYTDGAAYDPVGDTWRDLVVPGWGHPGLTSAYLDGQVYTVAKGGVTSFDPVLGQWRDLPDVDGMLLSAIVATDDAIWGLGPVDRNPGGPQLLAIARYDPSTDAWVDGATVVVPESASGVVEGLLRLETTVLWTGVEIVVWGAEGGGVALDPEADAWRTIAPPVPDSGEAGRSFAVPTSAGLAVLVDVGSESDGLATAGLAIATETGWRWSGARVPFTDFASVTVSGAGEWIVAFSSDEAPVTIHVPTGAWKRHDGAPIEGRLAPNMVWTGTSLVVWGGESVGRYAVEGAIWVAPVS